jgi:hypothetical protein
MWVGSGVGVGVGDGSGVKVGGGVDVSAMAKEGDRKTTQRKMSKVMFEGPDLTDTPPYDFLAGAERFRLTDYGLMVRLFYARLSHLSRANLADGTRFLEQKDTARQTPCWRLHGYRATARPMVLPKLTGRETTERQDPHQLDGISFCQ